MQRLIDQVAIVTGGAQGVGRGIASVLAAEGARVVIADVDDAHADLTVAALRTQGLEAHAVATDVCDRASIVAMTALVVAEHGRIDILAANAGIYPAAPIEAIDDALWDRVMDTNVKGAFRVVQACLPTMISRRYGRVVLTSSITGPVTGQTGFAHYGASKAAMLGFMRSAAVELATSGVTINAVLPGERSNAGVRRHDRGAPARDVVVDPDAALRGSGGRRVGGPLPRPLPKRVTSPVRRWVVDGAQVLPEGSSGSPSSAS